MLLGLLAATAAGASGCVVDPGYGYGPGYYYGGPNVVVAPGYYGDGYYHSHYHGGYYHHWH
jgi:hypothetical protein